MARPMCRCMPRPSRHSQGLPRRRGSPASYPHLHRAPSPASPRPSDQPPPLRRPLPSPRCPAGAVARERADPLLRARVQVRAHEAASRVMPGGIIILAHV
eukprot:6047944-Pyramimonas_sp.AAC.1